MRRGRQIIGPSISWATASSSLSRPVPVAGEAEAATAAVAQRALELIQPAAA
jgi:hypothetical protein